MASVCGAGDYIGVSLSPNSGKCNKVHFGLEIVVLSQKTG